MPENDQSTTDSERYYLCVTCGRLNHEDRFEEGAVTCNDCRADGRHGVNYREAPDGEGFVRTEGGESDAE